jgi:hypothetical protein
MMNRGGEYLCSALPIHHDDILSSHCNMINGWDLADL